MGIKGLNRLLKSLGVAPTKVNVDEFKGKKIAIDTSYHMCLFNTRGTFCESFFEFIVFLLSHELKPLLVFDGTCPDEKLPERENRRKRRYSLYVRIDKLESQLASFIADGTMGNEIRKVILDAPFHKGDTKTLISEYITRLKSYLVKLDDTHFQCVRELADAFGIPRLTASGEAEVACAKLCRDGLVDAVYTRDTDAMGCLSPVTIIGRDGHDSLLVTRMDDVLEKTGLTPYSFVDLCIMCGTDFNANIPRVAAFTAYGLIKEHKTIDAIAAKMDVSILNHKRVRCIFENAAETFDDIDWTMKSDEDLLRRWTSKYRPNEQVAKLKFTCPFMFS